jgi:GNAT superfamily N-acetyltransferase
MTLVEVTNPQTEKEFIQLPVRLYADEENWIRPLDKDIVAVFDPAQNKNFRTGEAIRWILKDDTGKVIGRIAAFVNGKTAHTHDQPTGGLGFFECENNQEAASQLFDVSINWLKSKGMEAVDGPINFGDRNSWWGLLVKGFLEPNFQMPYNFPYYKQLFEQYGFREYFKQFTYQRPMGSEVDLEPRFYKRAENTLENPDYEFRHIRSGEFKKAHEYFHVIYNKAWAGHSGVKPMTIKQAHQLFQSLKKIADNRLLWYAFYKGEPIAFFISMPDLNQIYKHLDGQWNLWTKLKLFYMLKTGVCKKGLGIIFGVVPDHQKKGVEGALVVTYVKTMAWKKGFPYKDIEMNWIGDFNPKMIRVVEQVGGKLLKTHITYRKLFDETKEFKRAPVI